MKKRYDLMRHLIIILIIIIIFSACSPNSVDNNYYATSTPDPRESGYMLIEYAEQYREISSSMIRKSLEQDYSSLETLLDEATEFGLTVDSLAVTSPYANAKDYFTRWIVYDCLTYQLILNNGSKEEISNSISESMNWSMEFVNEMIKLGHKFY